MLPLSNMAGPFRLSIALFTILIFIIFTLQLQSFRKVLRRRTLTAITLITLFTFLISFINGIGLGLPILSFVYSATQYYLFLPIIILSYCGLIHPEYSRKFLLNFLRLYFLLCALVVLNTFIDFGDYLKIPEADEAFRFDSFGNVRGNIFIPSTSTFVTLLPGLFIAYIAVSRSLITTMKFTIFIHIFLLACVLSLSRSSGILALFAYAASNFYLIFLARPKDSKLLFRFVLFNFLIVLGLSFPYFVHVVVPAETLFRYQAVSASDAYGNYSRFQSWRQGLNMISGFDTVFGNGFGTSNIRTAEIFSLPYYGHYESGIISIFSERGYLGLLEIFLVTMTLCFVVKGSDRFIFSSFAIAFLISTFTAPNTTGYFFPVAMGLITGVTIAHSQTALSRKKG